MVAFQLLVYSDIVPIGYYENQNEIFFSSAKKRLAAMHLMSVGKSHAEKFETTYSWTRVDADRGIRRRIRFSRAHKYHRRKT